MFLQIEMKCCALKGKDVRMFSVVVPLYNCEKYIKECVESLLNQTHEDYEIIIVNDGSTDDSLRIVEQIKDERVRIITQENQGLFHARISGLRVSKGDICLFLDADDLLDMNALETIRQYTSTGCDCVMYKLASCIDGNPYALQEEKAIYRSETVFKNSERKELLSVLFTSGRLNSIVCKAFKRELLDVDKLSQYPRIAIGEDALFTLELFSNLNKAIYIDKTLYRYRQQSASMSHNLKDNIYFDNIFRFNMYQRNASSFFEGEELTYIKKKIDTMTFRMTTAMALNDRYVVKDFDDFRTIFSKVSKDQFLIDTYNRAKRKQNLLFMFIVSMIIKKHFRLIFMFRIVYRILQKIKRRLYFGLNEVNIK